MAKQKPVVVPIVNPTDAPIEFSFSITGLEFSAKFTETERDVRACVHNVPLDVVCKRCLRSPHQRSRAKR